METSSILESLSKKREQLMAVVKRTMEDLREALRDARMWRKAQTYKKQEHVMVVKWTMEDLREALRDESKFKTISILRDSEMQDERDHDRSQRGSPRCENGGTSSISEALRDVSDNSSGNSETSPRYKQGCFCFQDIAKCVL